ncbi:uncharacterized protein [Cicer arietinum]|uniref:Transcription repressor n=1 Tax=Cicer arietinum TaxID=3827 RepID=A0A1S2Y8P4_CICAR|nr:transcription repressor OFP8-like [Cicer arietinum]
MAKRFKMKFTIPSFQMCRSDDISSLPGNPVPAIYRLSPVNPKTHDTEYPNLSASSPEHQCHVSSNIKKFKSNGRKSTSNVLSKKSEFLIDKINEEESETLISCLTRFSEDESTINNKTENRDLISGNITQISSVKKVERVRFHSTMENRRGKETKGVKSSMEEKVKESFAVVKKSKDPYEDFKKSMVEMIAEMEIYETEDLEQLLQCFLALNCRNYHGVIVRAFMEIWKQMFVWNPKSLKNVQLDFQTTDVEK